MTSAIRRFLRPAMAIAGVAALVAVFVWVPTLRQGLTVLGHLNWGWVALAVVAQSGSMAAFARSQKRLLQVGGAQLSTRSAVAITYAGNALATTLPIAGVGLGTAFAYRQMRRRGVDTASVAWALTVSGVESSLAFAAVMTVGALLSGNGAASGLGLFAAALNALPVLAVLAALRFNVLRLALNRLVNACVRTSRRWLHRPRAEAAEAFEGLLDQISGLDAPPRQYLLAFLSAVRNWTADCLCLGCSVMAVGTQVPWRELLLAYCLAKTAGSIGVTPGGVGVVEVALATALVNAGMAASAALPAVLVYRLISFWLVMAVGWLVMAGLSRQDGTSPTLPPAS